MSTPANGAPRFSVRQVDLFERDVRLRMPFRFGVVTLTEAPQAYVRARIRLADGREAEGGAAELMVPKWFDKSPALSNEDNFEQLRTSLRLAREAYLADGEDTAWGHWHGRHDVLAAAGGMLGLNRLVSGYGAALVDRALLDALCRALALSFYDAVRSNAIGAAAVEGIDLPAFLAGLQPAEALDARHTVGLLDPITDAELEARVADGLPESLAQVVRRYGHRWFKVKLSGHQSRDMQRLAAIAGVLDELNLPYAISLDGNEQFESIGHVVSLWARIADDPRLARFSRSVAFIEQPVARAVALEHTVAGIDRPLIIDESDDGLEAFVRARELGYRGVSSKACKGLYRSIINAARCAAWNRAEGAGRYFMTGEDLTVQPGLALQQDLALASLLGIDHVERNGHHYVNGMAGLPAHEQRAFLDAHPDLYEHSHGAVRVAIRGGMLAIGSLDCAGYATGALPDWTDMRPMRHDGDAE